MMLWIQSNGGVRPRRSCRRVKAKGVFRVARQKNPARLGRRLRLAAAADGGRVAH
jgi:hypothetical protein